MIETLIELVPAGKTSAPSVPNTWAWGGSSAVARASNGLASPMGRKVAEADVGAPSSPGGGSSHT